MILHSGLLFWATLYSMEHQFFYVTRLRSSIPPAFLVYGKNAQSAVVRYTISTYIFLFYRPILPSAKRVAKFSFIYTGWSKKVSNCKIIKKSYIKSY